jgi:hypothetical protein
MSTDAAKNSALHALAVMQSPNIVMTYRDLNGIEHAVFWMGNYNSFQTSCGVPLSAAPLSTISYGKPSCIFCMIEDDDPVDSNKTPRRCIKLVSFTRPGAPHVDVKMYMGRYNQTLVLTGKFVMSTQEWLCFRGAVVLGAKQFGIKTVLEESEH